MEDKEVTKETTRIAIIESLNAIAPELDDKTTLIIGVTPEGMDDSKTYTYAAILADGKWYLTGEDRLLMRTYQSTGELFLALGRHKKVSIELVTATETIR